ncbi:MAG: Gfo/Idh/MocA family oxidoreductase [Lentisphaeria bacterium]|nr:Gfo/Idh/MocA family oxidoreductase [Lentisphaeria bacterium]
MIKCGIIGCGVISPTHLAGYKSIADADPVFFCDLIPARAEKLASQVSGGRCFTDYRQMLNDPELSAVSVCTDHASHGEIVAAAISAGKHVICEKVSGRTAEDLELMLKSAAEHPEVVASGIFQHRFNPGNIALKNLIASGLLGKLLTVNLNFACLRTNAYYENDPWRGTVAGEGGGVLINQAIHFLDQLRFLFGDVRRVAALSGNLTHQGVIEVEDTVAFTAEFTGGLMVTVNATNSAFAKWRSALTICAARAQLEFIDEKLTYLDAADSDAAAIRNALECNADPAEVHGKTYYGTGHTAQLADFIDAIKDKRMPQVTLADAANSAAFVHAVYESCATGSWVELRHF